MKYNEVYFSFEGWYWHGIEDDIMSAWCKRFGEDLVASTLVALREWLKKKPHFEEVIDKGYGGNWCFWIWDSFERNEKWRKEEEMITKNYIKMCEKNEDLQREWKKKKSHLKDKIYIKESNEFLLITKEFEYEYNGGTEYFIFQRAKPIPKPIPFTEFNKEAFYRYDDGELNIVYLPTQEQLQEMINLDPITLIYLIDRFVAGGEGYWHSFAKAPYPDPSMNELWLAFVMKEKYNKSWTGKEWENEITQRTCRRL